MHVQQTKKKCLSSVYLGWNRYISNSDIYVQDFKVHCHQTYVLDQGRFIFKFNQKIGSDQKSLNLLQKWANRLTFANSYCPLRSTAMCSVHKLISRSGWWLSILNPHPRICSCFKFYVLKAVAINPQMSSIFANLMLGFRYKKIIFNCVT